jgi:uncharacterized membrane protein
MGPINMEGLGFIICIGLLTIVIAFLTIPPALFAGFLWLAKAHINTNIFQAWLICQVAWFTIMAALVWYCEVTK